MSQSSDLPDPKLASVPPRQTLPLPVPVTLERGDVPFTKEVALWAVIRSASESIGFKAYSHFIEELCCANDAGLAEIRKRFNLPFFRVDAYELLKAATDLFIRIRCGVHGTLRWDELAATASARLGRSVSPGELQEAWGKYLCGNGTIPYFDLLRAKFADFSVRENQSSQLCAFILEERLQHPCLVELIWSYWMEEAMLVQVLNAVSLRFQNRRVGGDRAVLAQLDIDPLRPLNNLLWGYIQDEQHRLSINRRAYEYDHAYGLRLLGRAVGELAPADSRSQFLEAFHRLLQLTARFFQQDDDTTVRADAFPVLNALKEVNIELGSGGGNQLGDMAPTARGEMLMQQWLLARPEMRDFFSSRSTVIYPEPWMERLDSARSLMGLPGPSVLHLYNLATMGERLLLSIRFHPWTGVNDTPEAANWARSHRSDVQGYIHAYHAVTGVDLSATAVSDRIDARLPSVLIRERLQLMARR
jgi:hypothetical protein